MKFIPFAAGLVVLAMATPALADAPKFDAACPSGVEVSSNGKGKVRIDGQKAVVKKLSSTSWRAVAGGKTVDIGRDGAQVFVSLNSDVCEIVSSKAKAEQ